MTLFPKRQRFPLNHRQRRREAAKIRRRRKKHGPPGPVWPMLLLVAGLCCLTLALVLVTQH